LVVCPSQTLERLIRDVSPDVKTTVIPNGFDVDRFSAARSKKRQILVLTRMFKRKGVQYVLEALANVTTDFQLNVVGDGPYIDTLRQMAKSHDVPVRFWGHVDNQTPQFRELLETSRIFVFPSESENFPTVLLEAMSSGQAIITTKGTGCEEVVGDTAILVPPKNSHQLRAALVKLMADPQMCNAMGKKARARLEDHFSWDAVADRYISCYRQLL
jgi:glycosyltransferase involved in cell wall biosynthesis